MVQVRDLVQPVFDKLPLDLAMPLLVGSPSSAREGGADQSENPYLEATHLVAHLDQELNHHPAVLAGLWLYVDDLDRSHSISQSLNGPTGAYWHAIMHRREGDFWNSKYWFRQVGEHPVIRQVSYDPCAFVDAVERDSGRNAAELLATQRAEWKALLDYCLKEAS